MVWVSCWFCGQFDFSLFFLKPLIEKGEVFCYLIKIMIINKNNKKDSVLAIVMARGGSKSIPRKNVLPFRGKPLVAWPIDLAKSVSRIDRVILTTDDDEIMAIGKKHGAETPFKRPKELADDETTSVAVLQHCVKWLEEHEDYKPDIILTCFPTQPLLKKETVERALDLFENENCNSVIGVVEDWGRFWKLDEGSNKYLPFYPLKRVNRQYYKPLYREGGGIYYRRYDVLMKMNKDIDENRIDFVVVDDHEQIDIDLPKDLEAAFRATENKK